MPAWMVKQNNALAQKYGITGYPTLILTDANGKKIGRFSYIEGGPKPFIERIEMFMATMEPKTEATETVTSGNEQVQPEPAGTGGVKPERAGSSVPKGWMTNYNDAKTASKESNRPVLILFTGFSLSSFPFGAVTDGEEPNTKNKLMGMYIRFLQDSKER